MVSDHLEEMKKAIEETDVDEDLVILSIFGEDGDIKIHEGGKHPKIHHEEFLAFYLKYLKEQHDLAPQQISQDAIEVLQERIE